MDQPNLGQLYGALAKAQAGFKPLAKNRDVEITMKSGGKFKFRYADLEAVIAATRPSLAENGLAVIQRADGGNLVSILAHESGGTIESTIRLPEPMGEIKNYGAAITYIRRYAYCALLCVAADDDLDQGDDNATAIPDASGVIRKIEQAQSQDALQKVFAAAWQSHPRSRAEIKTAYDARKQALVEFEQSAQREAVDDSGQ